MRNIQFNTHKKNAEYFVFCISNDNSDICAYIEIKYVYLKNKIYFDRETIYIHLFIIVIFCENFIFQKETILCNFNK